MSSISNGTATPLNFTDNQIMKLGYSQAGAALFSLMSSLCVILFIITQRKYRNVTQRLIAYLNIAVFFNSTSFIIRGIGYKAINNKIFCQMIGYYGQATGGYILAAIVCIIIEIVVNACRQKTPGKWLEALYLVLIFVAPMLTALIPFINDSYGKSTAWCWINRKTMQYALWYGPLFVLILFGGILYFVGVSLITYKVKKNKNRYTSDGSKEKQRQMLKELHQFRWYPILYLIINLVPLANRIVEIFEQDKLIFQLWLATGVIEGLQGILVALLYFSNSSTRKYIKHKMKNCKCCWMKNQIQTSLGESTPLSHSPQSSYEAVPSPYTASGTRIQPNDDLPEVKN